MELDYRENINEFGDNIVRLYNFDKAQAIEFSQLIKEVVVDRKQKLDLSKVPFIKPRNCNLIFGLFHTDEGILSSDNETFYCVLTLNSYYTMLKLLMPFCTKETKGHQYLYELDISTDLLFAPAATWKLFLQIITN